MPGHHERPEPVDTAGVWERLLRLPTFGADDLRHLGSPARVAVAARAAHRVVPLYQLAEGNTDAVRATTERMHDILLLAQAYCRDDSYRDGYERAHETMVRLAMRPKDRDFLLDPAASVVMAFSELANALTELSRGAQNALATIPNNALRAAALTADGLEALVRREIDIDLRGYGAVTSALVVPYLEGRFPLWSGAIPSWYLDSAADSLMHSFPIEEQINGHTIIEVANYVSDDLLRALIDRPEGLHGLEPRAFEELIAEVWARFGYVVELTQASRDGGRDVIAIRHEITPVKYLIECKRLARGRRVSIEAVRALWYVKNRDHATKAILATTGRFGSGTWAEFRDRAWELELREFGGVMEWLHIAVGSNARAGSPRPFGSGAR